MVGEPKTPLRIEDLGEPIRLSGEGGTIADLVSEMRDQPITVGTRKAEPSKIERFLKRNLRTVVRDGGMDVPEHVGLMHGSFRGIERTGEMPPVDQVCTWAEDVGLSADDQLILRGIAPAVVHAEPDIGRLTTEASDEHLVVRLTRDEASVARGALFILLGGPFCNMRHAAPDRDPFWEVPTFTGFQESDFQTVYDALLEAIGPIWTKTQP